MAKQIEGVYEKVLECAKAEFLQKGYKEASLRSIAEKSNTSTGSIYTRFSDKEGLFKALVLPVVNDLKTWFLDVQEEFHQLTDETQKEEVYKYSEDKMRAFVDYIYDNYDIFKLLITCAYGTQFSMFIHDFVEIGVEYTFKFTKATGNDAFSSGRVTPELLHMLSSAFYTGIFETVVHDMTREKAHIYVEQLQKFFQCGWKDILEQ